MSNGAEQKGTLLLWASKKKAEVIEGQLYLGIEHVFFLVFLYCNYRVLILCGQTAVSYVMENGNYMLIWKPSPPKYNIQISNNQSLQILYL